MMPSSNVQMKIMQRINLAAKALLSKDGRSVPAGRNLTVFPDDVFITSYPKSGNTWVRFLVSNLVWSDSAPTDFFSMGERTPDIYWHTDSIMKSLPRPRFIKSHEYFDPRYPKVIYIIRDVRAVFVSYYDFLIRFGTITSNVSLNEFAKTFLRGGIDKYASWRENVLSWVRMRGEDHDRFCLIRYEDLKLKPKEALEKIVSFLKIERSELQIKTAIEMSTFTKMRELEEGIFKQGSKKPIEKDRTDIPVVRSGRINGWQEILDPKILGMIKVDCFDLLLELGYEW